MGLRSRGMICPSFGLGSPRKRGSRECRMRAAPAVSRAMGRRKRTRAYRFSGGNPAFPAQGSIWGQKVELIQRGATVVFTFVSRSAGATICCAKKFCDAPDVEPHED